MVLSLLLGKYRGSFLPSSLNRLRSFSSKSFFFSQPTTERKTLLEVKDLTAVNAESKQEVLKGVNFLVREGELHMMNYHGPGNNVFLKVIFGDPQYKVTGGSIRYRGFDLLGLTTEQRSSSEGLMSFNPIPRLDEDEPSGKGNEAQSTDEPLRDLEHGYAVEDVKPGFVAAGNEPQAGVLGAEVGILEVVEQGASLDHAEMQGVLNGMEKLLCPRYDDLMMRRFRDNLVQFVSVPPWFTHTMVDGKISSPASPVFSNHDSERVQRWL